MPDRILPYAGGVHRMLKLGTDPLQTLMSHALQRMGSIGILVTLEIPVFTVRLANSGLTGLRNRRRICRAIGLLNRIG